MDLTCLCQIAWEKTGAIIVAGDAHELSVREKEKALTKLFIEELQQLDPSTHCEDNCSFNIEGRSLNPDVRVTRGLERAMIEIECKLVSDGAEPHNRHEAFFDLWKLEQYIACGCANQAWFFWLTNNDRYLKPASGTSKDFSTHQGRVYEAGTQLIAQNPRRQNFPHPLHLAGRYVFNWRSLNKGWWSLALQVRNPELVLRDFSQRFDV